MGTPVHGNAASTIAVGSWTPGVGPPESSESCAAALKTASKWIFSPNSPLFPTAFMYLVPKKIIGVVPVQLYRYYDDCPAQTSGRSGGRASDRTTTAATTRITRHHRPTRHFKSDDVGWNRHILSTNEPKRRYEHVELLPTASERAPERTKDACESVTGGRRAARSKEKQPHHSDK